MNRRTLFRTLAGALCAPLVEWLPKEEPRIPWSTQPIVFGPYPTTPVTKLYASQVQDSTTWDYQPAPPEEA